MFASESQVARNPGSFDWLVVNGGVRKEWACVGAGWQCQDALSGRPFLEFELDRENGNFGGHTTTNGSRLEQPGELIYVGPSSYTSEAYPH